MNAREISALHEQGQTELAYESARQLYATDKGPVAASVMFCTAVDILKKRKQEGRTVEAEKILLALERLFPNVPDLNGEAAKSLRQCQQLMGKSLTSPEPTEKEAEHTLMGKWGEGVAERYLFGKGYDIIEQDWRSGHRDIDIIARRGNFYLFVEVKTRRNRDFGDPLDAVDTQKLFNLRRAIHHYVCYHHIDNFRFDVITVVGALNCPDPDIQHYEDINLLELERSRPRKRR